ncbi:uncharacterized protein VTP21DRAFT_2988 [Calcarisporiella thermophila]|uniref:uncharacterized protein n=1 Tax=Calcarisporiella thermophila TaxID=911321 RepID=UPI0037432244
MEAQLLELLDFLHDSKPEVRQIAIQHIVGYTAKTSEYHSLFLQRAPQVVKDLKALLKDGPITAHEAFRALINLSVDMGVCREMDDADLLREIVLRITVPSSVLADISCMLLSNLTRYEPICVKLLNATTNPMPGLSTSPRVLDQLLDVFVKGVGRQYNPEAEFHFLSSVFANIAALSSGRDYFLTKAEYDGLIPLTKLVCFTEHENVIRRGSVDSTIKNCCFDTEKHREILDEDEINILPYILLPLCGPEEFDLDDMEGMPEDIQLLPATKKREVDPNLRIILLETLVLLTSTRHGRDVLRAKKVYPVIRAMHLAEQDERVAEAVERVVNMLMRDEGPESKIEELPDERDDTIEEI